MRIRLFPYFGSKVRKARIYPAPRHNVVVEPFAGSAGYSGEHYEKKVFLVEKDPKVFGALEFFIKASPQDIDDLPLIGPGESLDDHPDLPDGAQWLIGFWLNNGTQRPCRILSKWGRSLWPDPPAHFWGPRRKAKMREDVLKVKHWEVFLGSWNDIELDETEATWFVDPPYQGSPGRIYTENQIDYPALGTWCRNLPGQVIVCENEGADWLPFRAFYEHVGVANTKTGSKKRSIEAVWTKGC